EGVMRRKVADQLDIPLHCAAHAVEGEQGFVTHVLSPCAEGGGRKMGWRQPGQPDQGSAMATSTRRGPLNGARPCDINMLSSIRMSPACQGKRSIRAS